MTRAETTARQIQEIQAEISQVSQDVLVETNEGTHGMPDNYRTYERLDGSQYTVGFASAKSNGIARKIAHLTARQRRARIERCAEKISEIVKSINPVQPNPMTRFDLMGRPYPGRENG